jgi:hypothetical protein
MLNTVEVKINLKYILVRAISILSVLGTDISSRI